jgi:2-oxoglutarate ferredoxin oxidoreductase subunit beta
MDATTLEQRRQAEPRRFTLEDYEGATPRWCSGCGDLPVLSAVQRVCRDEQLLPEKTVVVSGIGCSSRFPHYMKTYGFHGLHGRALPVACGVRSRRPDLHVFVATGDGDCCAIGAGHWIHAIRYNMNMVVLMFDNNIYGLTKRQTSPTTAKGSPTYTHPEGSFVSPLNPIAVTLSVTNASFVAQTVDWNPQHLYATILAAHRHQGFSFVRILQRCPHFTRDVFEPCRRDPSLLLLMDHPEGIVVDAATRKIFTNQIDHDPEDHLEAQALAVRQDAYPIGLFYRNKDADRYDEYSQKGINMDPARKIEALEREFDRFKI